MDYLDYIELGLDGEGPLKVILCGEIHNDGSERIGVVSLVYATLDRSKAEEKIKSYIKENTENYYMVYSVPFDIDLSALEHYPSIAVRREDLD
ncbi:hypothetical protein [Anaerosphaera multitolerans]|uniref:Uncharacterized protein n=1 Tax=Anaerosphaera multitolerans TaxID=2487351 RepID=A0A437S834_9FIRM|nr:hypothetical protein [Anaerosphaera multitolerans]RVU55091.1 hypothetical protein EF514_04165 [Anaerosphaera multitolerans]